MYAWRYLDDNYTEDPDFVLTDLNIVKPVFSSQGITLGQVLRENAAWALADYGFKVVIAGSFGIFITIMNSIMACCLLSNLGRLERN